MNTKPVLRCLTLLCTLCSASMLLAADPPLPPIVHLLSVDPSAAEAGSDPASFIVFRIGPTNVPLTVFYDLGGEAIHGVDYQPLSGQVTICEGSFFASLTVTPVDDELIEPNESIVIGLHQPLEWPPPYLVSWPSIAWAEIADNDVAPTNLPPKVAIVSPPGGAEFEACIDLPIVARASDPDGRIRTVEFFAGTNSLGIVTNHPRLLPLPGAAVASAFEVDLSLYPDLETDIASPLPASLFSLVWSNVPPGRFTLTALATDNLGADTRSAPVEIKVHQPPPQPVVSVRATDPEAAEPNPLADHLNTATFTIHRTGCPDFPLTVFFRLGGTAANGLDYRELPFSATIPGGERTVEIIVEPRDDNLVEGDESVVLKIVEPVCAQIFPPPADCYVVGRSDTARAVIHDNDQPNLPPVVRLVRPLDGSIFLPPATIKIAAEARDFDGRVVTVEFFEGTNSLGIVTNNPAAVSETRPPFFLVWSNVPPGHYVLTAAATDNEGATARSRPVEIKVTPYPEPPIVSIETVDAIATEPGLLTVLDTASFLVSRTGDASRPLLVYYRIGGTASNGVDYRELSGKIVIPAGAVHTNIMVDPRDDSLVEGTETVVVKIQPGLCLNDSVALPDCYRPGTNYFARAIIRDNDFPPTNQPPKVEIVKPEDGDLFRPFADIALNAAAADADGYVRTVEFFEGTNSLGIVTNHLSPVVIDGNDLPDAEQIFRWIWSNAPPGAYVLTAKATDNRGASTRSAPVRIKVLDPPLPPVVTLHATDPFGAEGEPWDLWSAEAPSDTAWPFNIPDPARFTVRRSGGTNVDLVVYYSLGGTAANGIDYRELSGKALIPRGSWKADIVVAPIDDKLVEGTETVLARLLPVACIAIFPPPPDCYTVGDPAGAAVFIRDNDINLSPRLTITDPPDGALFAAPADIKIEVVTRDADGWVTKVEFFAGTNRIGVQEIFFIVPPPPGQLQSFSLLWTNVPAGVYLLTARATDNLGAVTTSEPVRIGVVTRPSVPIVTVAAADRVGSEPDPRLDILPDFASFKVSRHGDLSRALKVFYRLGGTAANGIDYVALSGEVLIPVNESAAPIVVQPLDDKLFEGTESVVVELVQPDCVLSNTAIEGCYLVGQPRRDVVYIRDNEAPPNQFPKVALISPPDGSVFDPPLDLRLTAAAVDSDGWVVSVEFFAGTNSLGIVTNHPWLLDPGNVFNLKTALAPEISPLNPWTLVWSNPSPGHHVLTALATDNLGASSRSAPVEITVLGTNLLPIVNITAPDALAREGTSNTAAFRIRRRGNTNEALTVHYLIRGTASNSVDYVGIPGSLTIPAGRRSARIQIVPIDDSLPERIETVVLRLVPAASWPPAYQVGRPARAGAVIVDNDCGWLDSQTLPDGSMHVRFPLALGSSYRLEASSDLLQWETLLRNVVSDDGSGFVDDESAGFVRRFYRVVAEPLVLEDD